MKNSKTSKFVSTTFNIADMLSNPNKGRRHCDLKPSEIWKSEKCVLKTMSAIQNFLNPFDIEDKGHLFIISSRAPVLADVPLPPQDSTLVIEDGNACFCYLKELPSNSKQITRRVFDMLAKSGDTVFRTNMYKADSIKAMKRTRRG